VNILIIDNSIAFTGALKCALSQAELLSQEHSFSFVLPEESTAIATVTERGYHVHQLPLKEIRKSPKALAAYPFFLIKNLRRLRALVKRERIDAVQVNDFYNLLGALLKLSGYRGKLITYVRFLPSTIPPPLRKLWLSLALKYSDYIIAVSDAVLRELPTHRKIVRIYDPVNLQESSKSQKASRDLIRLLYLGNFIQGKGQEHALDAFHRAYQQNSNLRLRFVGGDMGLAKNAAFKRELQDRANSLNLSSAISFDSFKSDVEEEIKNADIALNFSEAESFSLTCLEASFYGTPVIATRCGGPEEIIATNETGLLVPKKEAAAMAEAILLLAADPVLRQQYGAAAKAYVRKKFSKDNFVHAFKAILTS
jgi:L-malate glycosyltransferase